MDLGDFLVQIPAQLILMVCGSGLLFVVSVLFIAQRRSRRKVVRSAPVLDATLAPVDSTGTTPIAATPVDTAPAPAEPGLLARVWGAIHDFFFYSEEEKAERERTRAQDMAQYAPAQHAAPIDPPAPQFNAPPDSAEVLHLWRDVVDGSLIIQIGDAYYRTMGDIAAAGQERRFMAVLRELARIAKETAGEVSTPPLAPVQVSAPPAEPAPPVVTEPAPVHEDPAPAPVTAPTPEDFPPAAEEETQPEPPPSPEVAAMIQAAQRDTVRPSLTADTQSSSSMPEAEIGSFFSNVRNAVRRGGRTPAKAPEAPALSIADEIEEFLQARLRNASEALQDRRIHVRPAIDGGVRIEVDGQFFETVGDIPDEDVRTYVIDSIQAWESSR